jgi:hypothetical protein
MADYIDWPGQSGKTYRYWFLSRLAADAIKDEAGNYLFAKAVPDGFVPVYIGQADNLRSRLPSHERWEEAKRAGATHAMGHTSQGGEQARLDEERDLIGRWDPSLNTHHRPTPKRVG